MRLINDDPAEWGALAREGRCLRKGETYDFRGLLRTDGKPVDAGIRFCPRGQWRNLIAVPKLANLGASFSLKTAAFRNDTYEGYATFSPWIPPGASIVADDSCSFQRKVSTDTDSNKRSSRGDDRLRSGSHTFEIPCGGDARSVRKTRNSQHASSIVAPGH